MRHLVGGGVGGFWLLHRLKSKDKPMCTVLDEAKDKPMDIVLSRKINPCVLSRAARGLEAASDRLLLDITLAMFPGPANVCRCLSAPHHTTRARHVFLHTPPLSRYHEVCNRRPTCVAA